MSAKFIVISSVVMLFGNQLAYAQDTRPIDLALQAARLNENPIELKSLLNSSRDCSVEHELSQAFLHSRTLSGIARVEGLENWIKNHPKAPQDMRIFAHQQLGQSYFAQTQYEKAANALQASIDLDPAIATKEMKDAAALSKIAISTPPIRRVGDGGATVVVHTDIANQKRAEISIADSRIPMIVDTGAEISVIAESGAIKAGMQFLDGSVSVGTVTEDVSGKLALAKVIQIGEMHFENVLFLVLPDEQLTFADGAYFVDGIIGLPVFNAAGRIGWNNHAQELLLGTHVTLNTGQVADALWHTSGMGMRITYNDVAFPAFLDSGASRSSLTVNFLEHIQNSERENLLSFNRTITGVGGAVESSAVKMPSLTLGIGNKPFLFNDIVIATEKRDEAGGDIATLGSDMLTRAQSFKIDFAEMKYEVVLEN